ncbi:MAG: thiamine pyrophosphate-dependent dehydrogenase E1 component subunit alpha [Anaerolineales bacterium]|nr:thiamine pyrophosphate-dependent dehydrogenase E1 component subunit alpha [Anaerolineales bacterium]
MIKDSKGETLERLGSVTTPDLWLLYEHMFRSRRFEEIVSDLWKQGKISGEMHLGVGEEAIVAGVVPQLQEGDAMAVDHRGTPPLLMRGVDPILLLKEFLGRPDGLCSGMGGHMHLYSREHLAASSGIVGASGPAAVGFALAAQVLRPGNLAVAFFGEGAANQGTLMEAFNLAVAWQLPVLFVCKDNAWSITTPSASVTGGKLVDRVRGLGLPIIEVDGREVERVWQSARIAMEHVRRGDGPYYLHATCGHLEGHFLGDPFLRVLRNPFQQLRIFIWPLFRSVFRRKGADVRARLGGLALFFKTVFQGIRQFSKADDPLLRTRRRLYQDRHRLKALEDSIVREMRQIVMVAEMPFAVEEAS